MSRHVLTAPPAQRSTRTAREADGPDLVRAYLEDIGRTPLLTAEEEVDLARRIEAGVYAAELLRRHEAREEPVSAERAAELRLVADDGAVAKEHMVRANLRLVVAIAKRYAGLELPFLDIVQEGNFGLIRAVEKFDYAKGFKFSTYATWWIRQAIQRGFAEQSRVVRLPVHVVEDLSKMTRIERELSLSLGREPTPDEVAEKFGAPAAKVIELRRVSRQPISLDSPIGDDGDARVVDLMEDSDAVSVDDAVEQQALNAGLTAIVRSLPPREAAIIEMRFGLADGRPRTLEEVATKFGLTRERIRQLEKQSLAQLRHPSRSRELLAWAS
jgi:RNA polymerase primary sigma factor